MEERTTGRSRSAGQEVWAAVTTAVITAVGVGIVWAVRGRLPEPVATHWGVDGQADGFSGLSTVLVGQVLLGFGLPMVLLLLGVALKSVREMAILAVGLAVFGVTMVTGSVWSQRDLADAREATFGPEVLVALVLGTLAALVWWWGTRRRGPLPTADRPAVTTIGIAWTGELRRGGGSWLVGASVALVLVFAAVSGYQKMWWMVAVMLLLAAVVTFFASALCATVSIDGEGVRVRSLGFLRWASIPLATIEGAKVVTVEGLGDYGGFGLRKGFDGSSALVTASGEALRIERAGLPAYVVTVADARAAAQTLNQLMGRE